MKVSIQCTYGDDMLTEDNFEALNMMIDAIIPNVNNDEMSKLLNGLVVN